jgi:hypothetical protein
MDDLGLTPYTVDRFDGGMTDNYIDAQPNQFERADNFLLTDNAKLRMRFGSVIFDSSYYQIPAGSQRVGELIAFDIADVVGGGNVLLEQSAKNFYYRNYELPADFWANLGIPAPTFTPGWVTLHGPTLNSVLMNGDTTNSISFTKWNKHLIVTSDAFGPPMMIYNDGEIGRMTVRNLSLPELAGAPVVAAAVVGTRSYSYAFCYVTKYFADTIYRESRGPVTTLAAPVANAAEPGSGGGAQNNISMIPPFPTSRGENWNQNISGTGTAQVFLEIYRTRDGGTEYRRLTSLAIGTSTYTDTTTDTAWDALTDVLYTDGGILENTPVPECKYACTVDNVTYYANLRVPNDTIIGGDYIFMKNRVYQSQPDDPNYVIDDAFDDLEDEITGLGSANLVPVVFCKTKIYRIEGKKFNDGSGSMNHEIVSPKYGCVASGSIVQTPDGLVFAGNDGFYFTDGYRAFKISHGLEATYKGLVDTATKRSRIRGRYFSENHSVIWTVQSDAGSGENDSFFVLDLRWGLRDNSTFTTCSGFGNHFRPTAIEVFNGSVIRGDSRGYTFIHADNYYTDPRVDTGTTPNNWGQVPVVYEYRGPATNFGFAKIRKWVPGINVVAGDDTNVSIQVFSINDDSGDERALTEIKLNSKITWGDSEIIWGDPDLIWNDSGLLEEKRTFPARGLRCLYKQVVITNAFTITGKSDLLGTATVDPVGKTALLDLAPTFKWPDFALDYSLYFGVDNYSKGYLVTARSDDTLTFADPNSTSPSGSQKWILRGFRKGELLSLVSYTISYKAISPAMAEVSGDSGGNK